MIASLGIVIPHFNEEKALRTSVQALVLELPLIMKSNEIEKIIICIVDDGSTEKLSKFTPQNLASNIDLVLLSHLINLGQGAAIQTGIEYLLRNSEVEAIMTMDADGQHVPKDIAKFIQKLNATNVDIIFGNRFSSESNTNAPTARKLTIRLAILFEKLVTGLKLSDAHNGFRIFTRAFAKHIDLKQNRMAHATEFKQITKHTKATYDEVPTSIIYTEETLRKGQHGLNSLNILRDLFKTFLFDRY